MFDCMRSQKQRGQAVGTAVCSSAEKEQEETRRQLDGWRRKKSDVVVRLQRIGEDVQVAMAWSMYVLAEGRNQPLQKYLGTPPIPCTFPNDD